MSKAAYLADLKRRIHDLEVRMRADRDSIAAGSSGQKVKAAGDLVVVESRLIETKDKLARLETESEGAWENFKTEIEQDVDYLEAAFDRWVEGRP